MGLFDAVMVLGKELRRDPERARRELRARAAAASAVWRAGAGFVATLEARLRGQAASGSALVAADLRRLGVPDEAMVVQEWTRSTREEAVAAMTLFRERGVRRGLVVTARYHVPRVRRLFADVGCTGVAVHSPMGLWWLANAAERAWMEEGEPDARVMTEECRVEAVLSLAARALTPLPRPVRAKVEIAAGGLWRGVTDPVPS